MTIFAIEKLFKEHFRCAVYQAQSIVSSREVAEDIVQNVFTKLLDMDLSEVKYPKSFLYTCVRHAALDHVRNRDNSQRTLDRISSTEEFREAYPAQTDTHPEEDAEHLKRLRRLFAAIEQLPPKTREVVKMVCLNGRSYQEAADLLSVSLATVKSHMYQSFKLLRERLRTGGR